MYKSIVFLNILNKAFEMIIIVRFNNWIEKNNLLLSKQIKIRKKRFIEIILKIIINVIHIIWNYEKNNVTSLLLLNIINVFDNISYQRFLYNFRNKRVSK